LSPDNSKRKLDVESSYLELSYWQVGVAAMLVLVNGAASLMLGLKLGRPLLIAGARAVIQLLLIGFVLKSVFAWSQWYVVVAVMTVMTLIAGVAAVGRTKHRYRGVYVSSIVSVWASSWLMTAFGLWGVLQSESAWIQPQYAIPLLGMILGNTLNGISLGLDRLGDELAGRRDQVETLLCLGATRWEAAHSAVQTAVRTGMLPMINSMMVVGIVSLPGMMTGQLLSGVDPIQAVKYQIVILFLIAAGTALGTISVVVLSFRRLFNSRHQFLFHRLTGTRSR
jgi:putative ABC transport system permease protein